MKEAIASHLEGLTMEKQEVTEQPIGRLYGALQSSGPSVTLEEMEEAIIRGAGERTRT